MSILCIVLYLIDIFGCDAADSSRSSKFTPMYGADKRSVAPSVAISVEATVTMCAVKCLDLGQSCAGYNWRRRDDGRVDCDLKSRYSVDLDVANRDNWVYYASSYGKVIGKKCICLNEWISVTFILLKSEIHKIYFAIKCGLYIYL